VGVDNIDSTEEFKKLEHQIESAVELAELKPIYFRLNEIMQAFPGDFDVQFTGNEIKQRLMARGTVLKQQGTAPAQPAAPPAPTPAVEAFAPPTIVQESAFPASEGPADPAAGFAGPSPEYPLFPLYASSAPSPTEPIAPPAAPPEPPAPPAYFAEIGPPLSYPPIASTPAHGHTPAPDDAPEPPPAAFSDAALPELPVEAAGTLPPFSSRLAALFATAPPATSHENPPSGVSPAEPAPPPEFSFQDAAPPAAPVSPLFTLSESSASAPPEPALDAAPEIPPKPPAPPRSPFRWKRPAVIGPIAAVLIVLIAVPIYVVVHRHHVRTAMEAARTGADVQIDISTTPPGAVIKAVPAGSDTGTAPATCTTNCKLALAPGAYEFTASLDGFDPTTSAYTVRAAHPAALSMTLQPQAQSVRLLTDLTQGKVVVDDRPPVDLQDGQLVLDKISAGPHTMKIAGPNGDASFSFVVADAQLPAISGPVNARNMVAILVESFGNRARVVTNAGPWKLTVNGQPQSDAGPAGTDLTGFQPGVNEIVVGDGNDRRNMSESFGAAPMLTVFLKTDVNAGTLIVSTGLDDVRVFVNNKEYKLRTQHGKLRIQTLGPVAVRVAKSGFQDAPEQTAEVKKGAEVRLQFDLKPQPQFGSLEIRGGIAGTEVVIDQRVAGTVGPDGLFSVSAISPGEHAIELRHEQRLPKRMPLAFRAGQTVVLEAVDVALASANGIVRIARNPASATVRYRRGDETETREIRGSQIELPAGTYVFSSSAAGYTGSTARVQFGAGESRDVVFTLSREAPAAPAPLANPMAQFQDAQSWTKEGDSWVHKGGGFVPFKPTPKGIFSFKVELVKGGGVFRAGAIRWCLQYVDAKNYLLFEMDRKNFRAWVVKDGQRLERVPKTPHNLGNQKSFAIQIEVTPDRLVQTVRGGDAWKPLDSFAEPGRDYTQGKFAFLIQGNDEIAISDFQFVPK